MAVLRIDETPYEEDAMRNDLDARVERLEKAARRWRMAALAGVGVIVGGVLMGQIRIGAGGGRIRRRRLRRIR